MRKEVICIVGVGYVGLPLAIEFAKKYETIIGFDIDQRRISELKGGDDRTKEISADILRPSKIIFTSEEKALKEADFIIICVPTPIDDMRLPLLDPLKKASLLVGKNIKRGAIVIYESTVYPGLTEEVCLPILEKESGLRCGSGFKLGYSPERIVPGDKVHTLDKITKIVSGSDEECLNKVADLYASIITAGVYKVTNIKTAEATKIIENTQRDLNIGLINEFSLIFDKMGINTMEVINAAATKWNFHKYTPGLVGGHCISVDPHYLLYKAEKLGYHPKVILAGREVNDYMPKHIAEMVFKTFNKSRKTAINSSILLLGLTFKENLKDTRNSKAANIIKELKEYDVNVIAFDPLLTNEEAQHEFGVQNVKFNEIGKIDCVILVVSHNDFKEITLEKLREKMDTPILIDVKSFYNKKEAEELGFVYKSL